LFDADPSVLSVSIDAAVIGDAAAAAAPDASATVDALRPTLGLSSSGPAGKGVGIAVVDTGIEISGDFKGVRFLDFTDAHAPHPYDDFGHGTHVSGLIASRGTLSDGLYSGVAPKARVISLKALDAHGLGRTSSVISAIEYAIANRAALGIDVLNLSLGHPILEPAATDPLVQAVEAASKAGITVVVAAGNAGRNVVTG